MSGLQAALEALQGAFPVGLLRHKGGDTVPVCLLVIAAEMFEDCNTAPVCHRFRLDFTADIGHDRVFGVIFEVPSRIWRSV